MKTLRKLLAGTLLVALAAFGLAAFAYFVDYDPDDPPVNGFTDKECRNEDWKIFENHNALIAADGQPDPNADDPEKIWKYYSYIEWGDHTYTCHLLKYEAVKVKGVQPKKPITRGVKTPTTTPTPTPQDPPREKSPAEVQADNFTDDAAKDLQQCWEKKLDDITVEAKGWNSDAIGATEVTWGITKNDAPGDAARTYPSLGDDPANPELSISVVLYPHQIAVNAATYWMDQQQQETFKHMVAYAQIHETFHIGYLKSVFDRTNGLPKPYEAWDMEIQAHKGASSVFRSLFGGKKSGAPGILREQEITSKLPQYQEWKDEYTDLEAELAKPETTEARKKEIESEMET
ncbi:MAG: hypothetical protein F4Z87_04475 [Gammaproteobacteria bacterium]|nr:hypothetical protein [Gammaproteobacteria bacterium]